MKWILPAMLVASIAMPAEAQMMKREMSGPTMKQCQMGYRTSYMKSMGWSRSDFRSACAQKMMTDGKMKSSRTMMKKDM